MKLSDFQSKLSVLNDLLYFDENDYLREKTTDVAKLKKIIVDAKHLLSENKEHTYYLCGMIGNLYRICEEAQKAFDYLHECLDISLVEGDIKKEIGSLIRLGEALKYDSQPQKALTLFNRAYTKCCENQVELYADFALQHKGKCLMELGELEEAERCFTQSLKLRQQKANPSLIKSTKLALELVRNLNQT